MYDLFRCFGRRFYRAVDPAVQPVLLYLLNGKPFFVFGVIARCRYPPVLFFFCLYWSSPWHVFRHYSSFLYKCRIITADNPCILIYICVILYFIRLLFFLRKFFLSQDPHEFFTGDCFFFIQIFCEFMKFSLIIF